MAFFDPYPHVLGGAQVVTLLLIKEFIRRGKSVSVVATGQGELTRRAEELGAAVTTISLPKSLSLYGHRNAGAAAVRAAAAMPVAWARIASNLTPRPKVLHAIDLRGLLLSGPPARALGVPVVWHLHTIEPQPSLNRLGGMLASRIVVPSKAGVTELPSSLASRANVIFGAVPDELFEVPTPRFEEPLVVCAARLAPEKGLDVLIEATAALRCRVPEIRVQVFGSVLRGREAYAAGIEQKIVDMRLGDRFQLCGFVDQPAFGHWSAASVYVQPSRWEGRPLAVLEAMTIGLPVVATTVGGLPEIVEHGETGLLVSPDDPEALAGALAELLTDRERARRMGMAARERVRGQFSAASMADALEDLYAELN